MKVCKESCRLSIGSSMPMTEKPTLGMWLCLFSEICSALWLSNELSGVLDNKSNNESPQLLLRLAAATHSLFGQLEKVFSAHHFWLLLPLWEKTTKKQLTNKRVCTHTHTFTFNLFSVLSLCRSVSCLLVTICEKQNCYADAVLAFAICMCTSFLFSIILTTWNTILRLRLSLDI